MSQISKAIFPKAVFGALAVSMACGAIQLAFGHDLAAGKSVADAAPAAGINRAAKADRAPVNPAATPTRTVLLRLNGLPDTSVLLRVPAKRQAGNQPASSLLKSGDLKRTVACEPMVSVLTAVAKRLPPGRCVT